MALIAPTVETIGDEALTSGIIEGSVTELQDDMITSLSAHCLRDCGNMKRAVFGAVKTIGTNSFNGCKSLEVLDFWAAERIGEVNGYVYTFQGCDNLKALIFRNQKICEVDGNYFTVPNVCYIYVPSALVDSYKNHSDWSNYANKIRAIEDYPEVCDPYSWVAVSKTIENGTYKDVYKIGDCVPVDLGSEGVINMQIAAFDADALADGSGTAAISWVAKESLLTTSRMSPGIVKVSDGVYQEGTGSIGGWDKSEMRSYLETTLLPTISSSLRDIIAPVKKVSMSTAVSGTSFTEVETVDSLWIPSSRELNGLSGYGSAEKNGCQYSELYKSDAAKIVYTQSGSKCTYSTRSAKDMDEYLTVGTSGGVYNNIQTTTKSGVCLGFCTGRTP